MIDGRQKHEIETTPKKCAPEIKFVFDLRSTETQHWFICNQFRKVIILLRR